MQAVILAGGEGKRLRPLTCNMPKPLAPLCNRPVIDYILDLLKAGKINDVTVTLMYQGDKIKDYIQNEHYDMNIEYAFEDTPLGTAGCVKQSAHDDEVIVISGDAMCDFNLLDIIDFHHRNNADATIVVKRVADPREYGLVVHDENFLVKGFVEKPSFESCTTDLANTGVYVLSRSALDMIEDNKKLDFAQDIFPDMLKNNMRIFAYEESGYWCDIGDFTSYCRCQRDILDKNVCCNINGHMSLDGIVTLSPLRQFSGVKIIPPVYIGRNVTIGEGTIIRQGTVIEDNVTIGKNARINSSVLLKGCFLGDRVTCNNAVVCSNAKLMRGAGTYEGSVIGEDAVIGENAVISSCVKIWQNKVVEANTVVKFDIKYATAHKISFDDEGICGETNVEITPQMCVIIGGAICTLCSSYDTIGIGYADNNASCALAQSIISGITSCGVNVRDFGRTSHCELDYCAYQSKCFLSIFVEGEAVTKIKIKTKAGLPLTRQQERQIEAGINNSDFSKALYYNFGSVIKSSDILSQYPTEILSYMPYHFNGMAISYHCKNSSLQKICNEYLQKKNDINGELITVNISADGKRVSMFSEEAGTISNDRIVLLVCGILFSQGKDVAIQYDFPRAVDMLAQKMSCKALRYYNCTCDKSDMIARKLAENQIFLRDALMLTGILFSFMSKNDLKLKDMTVRLPEFYKTERYITTDKPVTEVLSRMSKGTRNSQEGVVIEENNSRVMIRPVKTGKGLMMYVESFKSETAAELCNKFENIIRNSGEMS